VPRDRHVRGPRTRPLQKKPLPAKALSAGGGQRETAGSRSLNRAGAPTRGTSQRAATSIGRNGWSRSSGISGG